MNVTTIRLGLAIFIAILVFACQTTELEPTGKTQLTDQYKKLQADRDAFSKTLAVALEDLSVRQLIQSEAGKKFDGEEEVLFQAIKDRKLNDGQTLINRLIDIHGSEQEFIAISDNLPLLTILVPSVYKFSNDKWDVNNQIPAVAALKNKHQDADVSELNTFYSNGKFKKLQKNIIPDEPVLVVKDSERVILSDDVNKRVALDAGSVFQAGNFSFRYASSAFENSNPLEKKNANARSHSGLPGTGFDDRAVFAKTNNLQFHRDYIYYGIAPELGVNNGSFNSNYREFITSMRFETVHNVSNAFDDVMTDWSDGRFEFAITVLFVDNKTAPSSVVKVFDVGLSDLCTYTINPDGSITINSLRTYDLYRQNKSIEIAPWDMKRYGDTWKFVIHEQDATTNTSYSYTTGVTSSFGTNYSSNQKEGPNFGSTTSLGTSYSQEFSLTVAGQSDVLGESLLHWSDNVINTFLIDRTPGHDEEWHGSIRTISTGSVKISVEPMKVN